jgi:hypothetical protein
MHKDKLQDILNSEFESVQARLHSRITQLFNEHKLTREEATILLNCVDGAENPWLPWLDAEDEDETDE